jgi:hypothetical protein
LKSIKSNYKNLKNFPNLFKTNFTAMPGRRSPRRTNDDPLLDLDKTLAELTTKSPSTATDGPMDAFLANSLQAQDHQQSLAFVPASSFSFLMDDETSLSTMLLDSPAGIDTAVHADDSQFSFVQDLMSSSLESMSPTLSGSGFDDDDDEIPDQVGYSPLFLQKK